ncbi:MAG: hypothetical protein OEX82_04975 [Nitrosomonas sp.]|nr:hypothetical protein [Nitrosomonas sp.]
MKLFFILLLIVNLVLLVVIHSASDENASVAPVSLLNPEKIKLLPSHVPCIEWGGFVGTDLLQAESAMAELELGDQLSQVELDDVVIHWVYIPPFKTLLDAQTKINQLKILGVESFLVQKDSQWLNAISIAVLSDLNAAQKLLLELKDKGLSSVTIDERNLKQVKFVIREPETHIKEKMKLLSQQFSNHELKVTECERL